MAVVPLLAAGALFMAAAMGFAWLAQFRSGNAGWVDVVWTLGTGATGAGFALIPGPGMGIGPRQIVIALLAAIWSLRLALHIALRVAHGPEDARYANLRRDWGAAFQARMFWFLQAQAACTLVLVSAILLAARNPAPALRPLDLLGVLVMAAAVLGERAADRQLARFKAGRSGRKGICDAGLWGWSRHPNYFFEWLGWLAYPLMALGPDYPWGWAAFAAPAMMYAILVHGTGIPTVEAQMLRSRGAAFRRYQARVSAFLPLPPGRRPEGVRR